MVIKNQRVNVVGNITGANLNIAGGNISYSSSDTTVLNVAEGSRVKIYAEVDGKKVKCNTVITINGNVGELVMVDGVVTVIGSVGKLTTRDAVISSGKGKSR